MLWTSWNRADHSCPKGWGQSFRGAPLHVWGHCINLCWHQPSFMEWSNVQPAPGHHYTTTRNSITAYNTVFGYSANVTTTTWTFSPNFPMFILPVFFHWGMKKGFSEHNLSYLILSCSLIYQAFLLFTNSSFADWLSKLRENLWVSVTLTLSFNKMALKKSTLSEVICEI